MKISCIQMNMEFASPDENFKRAEELITKASEENADVIILPEMWNTGFFPTEELLTFSDKNGIRVKREISRIAKKLGINIVAGSVANAKFGGIYNTSFVFGRNGECLAEYDKTHLFTPMGEDQYFKKGDHISSFEIDGVKCAVAICYDIRFPEFIRTLALRGLDVLFVVSQWPLERKDHLLSLLKVRAIENQMFVACCNSASKVGKTVYAGSSAIYGPWGEELVRAGDDECIVTAVADTSLIKGIRDDMNVFSDRRCDLYEIK